jgi:hypothetical protein
MPFEIKASEVHDMLRKMTRGESLNDYQKGLQKRGLKTVTEVQALIDETWQFLANPPVEMFYIASMTNKRDAWTRFKSSTYRRYTRLQDVGATKKQTALLSKNLQRWVLEKTFTWLLERLDLAGADAVSKFSDAFLIGDATSRMANMYEWQAWAKLIAQFTDFGRILNNVWYGSSVHNPMLQIADWVAYCSNQFASDRPVGMERMPQLAPRYRGYPDNLIGRGWIFNPKLTPMQELRYKQRVKGRG